MSDAANPSLSLADDLVQPVYFGKETLTFRMGDKYAAGYYHEGACVLKSADGTEIPVELSRVPKASSDNSKGTIRIGDLTKEELIANGILDSGGGFTEKSLSVSSGRNGLMAAHRFIEKNMRKYYPPEKGYAYNGLDTEIYALGWKAPDIAPALNELKRAFTAAAPVLSGGTVRNPTVTYYPELNEGNKIAVVLQAEPRPGANASECGMVMEGNLSLTFMHKGVEIYPDDSNGLCFCLKGPPKIIAESLNHLPKFVTEWAAQQFSETQHAASVSSSKRGGRRNK